MSTTSTPCAPAPPPHHPALLLLRLLSLALRALEHPHRRGAQCAVRHRRCHRQIGAAHARDVCRAAGYTHVLSRHRPPRRAPTPSVDDVCTIARTTLFATETFSMGLNMPAKTVVFTSVRSAAI